MNVTTCIVSAKVPRTDCTAGTEKAYHTESIAKWALNAGKSIGLVTTTRVLNAYCNDQLVDDIAEQLVHGEIPALKEMAMKAIEILQTNPNGFFLFVEGGRIDHGLHDSTAHIAFEETAEFSRAIKLATKMLSTDAITAGDQFK
ncbi:membrane-bound alkaline phosphatase-like [Contarinia nasturtii]|uniref:membrane-bound alkaline phosphatase-like n=1 Tax=Contarinia nasturtii TaxID=265458 RepID=UPI0012D3E008|nr:membrane-bound alkaline phosphatase-like [Contarinia nasturtii]